MDRFLLLFVLIVANVACAQICGDRYKNLEETSSFRVLNHLFVHFRSVIEGNEMCDDGNTNSNDGCDVYCQVEIGWYARFCFDFNKLSFKILSSHFKFAGAVLCKMEQVIVRLFVGTIYERALRVAMVYHLFKPAFSFRVIKGDMSVHIYTSFICIYVVSHQRY